MKNPTIKENFCIAGGILKAKNDRQHKETYKRDTAPDFRNRIPLQSPSTPS